MKIIFVMQVLFGWYGSGSLTNMTISTEPHTYETMLECQKDQEVMQAEADKVPSFAGGHFYFICRPAPLYYE